MYGGAALNAAHAMIKTLDGLVAHDGTLAEPLRKGIAAPTDEEIAGWAQLPAGADELADQGARPKDPDAARDFYRRTFAEPAVDVNGISPASRVLQKTVLPVEAIANVSIRLAPGQTVEEIAPEVERILRESAPDGADVDVELWSSSPPGLVPPDAKAVQLGLDAFERALGRRPALIRERRDAADRARARRQGDPDGDHRLRPARLADALAERAARRGLRPARDPAARELYLAFAAL